MSAADANAAAVRIGEICAADFAAVVGGPLSVQIVTDAGAGEVLGGAVLATAEERPRATLPGSTRTAFALHLKVPDPGRFQFGHALIDVPGKGWVGPVYLERTLPPPGDPAGTYFSINFN